MKGLQLRLVLRNGATYSMTKQLYSLEVNGGLVLAVNSDCAYSWLPRRPFLCRKWLRTLVGRVMREHARKGA